MKSKKVAIVITTYNQSDLLFKCLNSIKSKTTYKNYKVYFVDDGSKIQIGNEIKKKYPWVNVSINQNNLGFSKANNIGIKNALESYNPDYVLLLNDDTEIIQSNWLNKLIKTGESSKKIGILGCKLVYEDLSMQNAGGFINKWEITKLLRFKRNELVKVDHVMGAFMLIKRSVINKIGLLDEIYTPYLLEDTDFCLRAKRAGFEVVSDTSVTIIHKKGKTINSLKSRKSIFIRFKNDIIFSLKNLSFSSALFRIFIYLPLVCILKKKRDEDSLKFSNFQLKRDFIINLFILLSAFPYSLFKYLISSNE